MPTEKPLAVSHRIAAIFFDMHDAALTSDKEWKEAHIRSVDAQIRPLVEAPEEIERDIGMGYAKAAQERAGKILRDIKAP